MTLRAVTLGLALALAIAAFGYVNDAVIRQTYLAGNLVPPAVFGSVLLLMLLRAPGLRLGAGELAVIAALGLMAIPWPSNNIMRAFTPTVSVFWHWEKTQPSWQAHGVTSYLPHGSPIVAPGQVRDWDALMRAADPAQADTATARRIAEALSPQRLPQAGRDRHDQLLAQLNLLIERGGLAQHEVAEGLALGPRGAPLLERAQAGEPLSTAQARVLTRAVIDAALPEAVVPMPRGAGLTVRYDAAEAGAVGDVVTGTAGRIDWEAWAPPMRTWLPLLAALGLGMFCLALIVHPQWSRHESLDYPIPRFLYDTFLLLDRGGTRSLAHVPRGFWVALLAVFAVHLLNGLHTYFPALPHIQRNVSFVPLFELFPNARQTLMAEALFNPVLYPSVIGFAYLLRTEIGFSLGVSGFLWMIFASIGLAHWGVSLGGWIRYGSNPNNMLLFGAYVGLAVAVLYYGRSYYVGLTARACGLGRSGAHLPPSAVWAARCLPLVFGAALVLLINAGLAWPLALAFLGLIVLIYVVSARIVAESGLLLLQANWVPAGALLAMLGFDAIGPTQLLLIGLLSIVLAYNTRDVMTPQLLHGCDLVARSGPRALQRFAPLGAAVLVVSLLITVGVTLALQSRLGMNLADSFGTIGLPNRPFIDVARRAQEATADGMLSASVAAEGLDRLSLIRPDRTALGWALAGLIAYLGCAALRLRLSWWVLHPIVFLVWGTRGATLFAASFLIGAALKWVVVRFVGVPAYDRLKPVMLGLIAAELLAALTWSLTGAAYFMQTGLTPPKYLVFPG